MTTPPARRTRLPLILGLFLFALFGLTSSTLRFGYEGPHIDEAVAWVAGGEVNRGVGGVVEIAGYVPSAWVKHELLPPHRLISIQNIAFVFVQPLLATAICLVFFGFALELYRRQALALGLTLILAFGTTVWPYAKFGMENHQTLWTLLAAWMLVRYVRELRLRAAALFALAMGLLVLTKATGMVHCAALFGAGCWLAWRRGLWRQRGFAGHAAVAALIGASAIAVLLATNHARYGGLLFGTRYQPGTELATSYFLHSLFGSLIGPGKSLFLFSPPLLIALWYFARFFRRFEELVPIYVALLLLALWYFAFSRHFNDETWGPRRLHWAVPFLLLPAGIWWENWGRSPAWQRALAGIVLAAGLLVQALAVSFDYTAHAFVMARHPVYSIQNNVWLPEMNAIRFNAHLLGSHLSQAAGANSRDYTIEWHYVPWDAPDNPPPPLRFPVDGHDRLDFWWLHEAEHWFPAPYWLRQASSFVAIALLLLALAAFALLLAIARLLEVEEAPDD